MRASRTPANVASAPISLRSEGVASCPGLPRCIAVLPQVAEQHPLAWRVDALPESTVFVGGKLSVRGQAVERFHFQHAVEIGREVSLNGFALENHEATVD